MFATEALLPASSNPAVRNPRRRPRTLSDENTAALPQAKKRRSALAANTFVRPGPSQSRGGDPSTPNPTHEGNGALILNGAASKELVGQQSSELRELPLRATRKASGRGHKAEAGTILTKNDHYVVSRLPALPELIRAPSTSLCGGAFFPDTQYALAATQTHVVVWPYRALSSTPETFVFALPQERKDHGGRLPLLSLVAASVSSAEPGLVIVMPTTGKITYWESVTSAAALGLARQQRQGAEATLGGLASGEWVQQLVSAEPAGFVLVLSSGRMAWLSLRDNQGRAAVRVQMIRSPPSSSGSLFGSFKNALVGGPRMKDLVAVRAGHRARHDDREIVVVGAKGAVHLWTMHRTGQHTFRQEWLARNDMMAAILKAEPDLADQWQDGFAVLDFAFVTEPVKGDESRGADEQAPKHLLFLGVFNDRQAATYVLFEVSIIKEKLRVGLVSRIRGYSTPLSSQASWRPRLILPQPGRTAFVVFERSVVITVVSKGLDSPDHQLLREMHRFPISFEDVVDFRRDLGLEVVGCASEDGFDRGTQGWHQSHHRARLQSPGCVLLIKGVGVVRIVAQIVEDGDGGTTMTAKAKIEQAICYGTQPSNPLDFSGRPEIPYPVEEVEEAALRISREILNSTSKAVLTLAPSLEHQLSHRLIALRELASYLKSTFPPLSRVVKWRLMWDGEKMAAAKEMWKRYEATLKRQQGGQGFIFLEQMLDMMNKRVKEKPDVSRGEVDEVRHWFTKDIGRLQHIIPWVFNAASELKDESSDSQRLAELVLQGNEILLAAFSAAREYRQQNAALYGIEGAMKDGVLQQQAYKGLPEFWTSMQIALSSITNQVKLSHDYTAMYGATHASKSGPSADVGRRIAADNVELVRMCCEVYRERYRWCSAQSDNRLTSEGRRTKKKHLGLRKTHFERLSELGQVDAAIELAEKYADMDSLVELVGPEIVRAVSIAQNPHASDEERARGEARAEQLQDRCHQYFSRFGDPWAAALFTKHIERGRLAGVLDDHDEYQAYLTRFLRAHPAYAKLGWINEVLVEQDLDRAQQALLNIASIKERDVWSKRVELSVGKLALLAAAQDEEEPGPASAALDRLNRIDAEFNVLDVQQKLYQHIAPTVRVAIDEKAERQLVRSEFGRMVTKDMPALNAVLEQGLITLVAREVIAPERLVDVLTLMDHRPELEQDSDIAGREFLLALQLVHAIRREDPAKAELLERIVWRRCMIQDDWIVINDTQLKDDDAVEQAMSDTALFNNLRAGYRSGFFVDPSPVRPLRPADVLGAGASPADLYSLFPEDLCAAIAADLRQEDQRLQRHLDKGRLDHWFAGIVDAARESVQEEQQAKAAALAELQAFVASDSL
ncbi:MAG: hypothetical protein M1826_005676 [Phylliscum demangeonii]|nr:MAG: hypothetical protein M1826_005676 [Phylliscum demangeonii]